MSARILLVDDEVVLQELLSTLLELNGYVVEVCGGAHEAIALLKKESFDLIVTDVRMPEGDGLVLSRWVQEHRNQLPLILMSGGNTAFSESRDIKHDWPYLPKPIEHERFLKVIQQCLASPESFD